MNTSKLKLALLVITSVAFAPSVADASTATKLSDTTVLFTIDFAVSARDELHQIPIQAKYGVSYYDRVDVVGFELGTDNPDSDDTPSIVSGVVLADAPIDFTSMSYSIDPSTTKVLTLVIAATFEDEVTDSLMARITKLPYFVGERRTTMHERQIAELPTAVMAIE